MLQGNPCTSMAARILAGGKHENRLAGVGYPAPAGTHRCPLLCNADCMEGHTRTPSRLIAGLVAGRCRWRPATMFPSVRSRTPEQAGLVRERRELNENPAFELDELAEMYVKLGVYKPLARARLGWRSSPVAGSCSGQRSEFPLSQLRACNLVRLRGQARFCEVV